jgi:hypothetical protein
MRKISIWILINPLKASNREDRKRDRLRKMLLNNKKDLSGN